MSFKIDTVRRRDPHKGRGADEPVPGEGARSLDVWKRMAAARRALTTDPAARRQMEQDPGGFLRRYGLQELPAGPARAPRLALAEGTNEGPVGLAAGLKERGAVAAVWVGVVAHSVGLGAAPEENTHQADDAPPLPPRERNRG